MAACLVIGQSKRSRMVSTTARQVYRILKMLVEEKGVTKIYMWDQNAFERDCCAVATRVHPFIENENVTYYLDAVGLKQSPLRRAILGRWANCADMKDIPYEVIQRGKEKLVKMCDYIIAGMEHESDLIAMAEYGRSLGKPVWKVFA